MKDIRSALDPSAGSGIGYMYLSLKVVWFKKV